jgi:type II secretory ATPase GspE/PulE/Tfp pilus assembly ATPase PilB-like protein
MFPGIVSRIKILSGLDIAERRRPQDGRCEVRIGQKVLDLRISTFPTVFGEKIVMRVLDRSSLVPNLQELGMEVDQMEKLQKALKKPYGVVLITGPTGAGKTTTLYAALSHLNSPKKNIVTLEDPVEYRLEGINQAQIRPEIGLTFANYLRHVLRQDPNIIMVGEIRDAETAEIAVRAALTGHLVLSTIHTNDSISTITRLIDMGVEPYLLQPALHLVVAQRLIRKLCPECKEPAPPSNLLPAGTPVYQPQGCDFCSKTGYWGRIGIFEVLEVTPRLKELFMQKANYGFLQEEAKKDGMKTLFDVALNKAAEGVTSLEEALGVVENP